MNANDQSQVTMFLAVACAVTPVLFGFALWKMREFFVSKELYNADKSNADLQRAEMAKKLERIDDNVMEMLKIKMAEAAVRSAIQQRESQ